MGFWRYLYKRLFIYDYYPDEIPKQNIENKDKLLNEFKEYTNHQYILYYKLHFNEVLDDIEKKVNL